MRIKFNKGEQRRFFDEILKNTACPSLRELINRGVDINYSSLKNYYCERRCLPYNLFESLCYLGKLNKKDLNFEILSSNWGQVKGGRVRFK